MIPMNLTGAEIVVRALIEQGCQTVFGYPGGQVIHIYDALYEYQDELRHVLTVPGKEICKKGNCAGHCVWDGSLFDTCSADAGKSGGLCGNTDRGQSS